MSAILDEFITLTPQTCVEQVNALLNAESSEPRSCKVFYTLFGVYCGVLAYRAYKNYAKRNAVRDAQTANVTLQVINEVPETDIVSAYSALSGQLAPDPSPILLQPTDISNTDMRWRYGPQHVSELKEDSDSSDAEEKVNHKGSEIPTVSVGTSTKVKNARKHEAKLEGDPTFSV